ncbi:putative signal peptide protein [Puccinia sorghi]|uniref:Putative signal peptide protein n=1 Tax=Puccinia sorghi TaxID=27349 RepID=A0A0L6UEG6_9BASI|nr:putative signal peptide protein [Puccinia sorghi]
MAAPGKALGDYILLLVLAAKIQTKSDSLKMPKLSMVDIILVNPGRIQPHAAILYTLHTISWSLTAMRLKTFLNEVQVSDREKLPCKIAIMFKKSHILCLIMAGMSTLVIYTRGPFVVLAWHVPSQRCFHRFAFRCIEFDIQKVPGSFFCCTVTVPKHLHMQTCGVLMEAQLEHATFQLQEVENFLLQCIKPLFHCKRNLLNCLNHCAYCTVTVPKHLHKQIGEVWMTAWLDHAACQLLAVEPFFLQCLQYFLEHYDFRFFQIDKWQIDNNTIVIPYIVLLNMGRTVTIDSKTINKHVSIYKNKEKQKKVGSLQNDTQSVTEPKSTSDPLGIFKYFTKDIVYFS